MFRILYLVLAGAVILFASSVYESMDGPTMIEKAGFGLLYGGLLAVCILGFIKNGDIT